MDKRNDEESDLLVPREVVNSNLSFSAEFCYTSGMNANAALDRVFDPIRRCLTPAVARKIVALRADPDLNARIQELADKANEGQLTPNERAEYESYIRGIDLIAILQSKARRILAGARKKR